MKQTKADELNKTRHGLKKNSAVVQKIVTENNKLLKEIKRTTAELNQKNREIEIETALDKVRAIALHMRKPADMLSVCKTISLQLQALGVHDIRNVQTAIFYEGGTYMNYEYYAKHRKTIITDTNYTNNKIHKAFAVKMLKGKGEFFITHIKGKKVKDWVEYQKTTNVFIDKYLEKAGSLNYYWHSLGSVALGISTYVPLRKEDLKLFHRFLNVFELAYTRYLDIEQALIQVREANIEVALERVRSRSMAMHQPGELAETASLMFQQLKELGLEYWTSGFCIYKPYEHPSMIENWMSTGARSGILPPITLPFKEDPGHRNIYEAYHRGEQVYEQVISGEDLTNHYQWMRSQPSVQAQFKQVESSGISFPTIQYKYAALFKYGYLLFISPEPRSGTSEIAKRFAKVFEQTYTRFLDLQKAEAQAREAQIELGLERVRARAMAMQNSNELADLVGTVFKELTKLHLLLDRCIIMINDPKTNGSTWWLANPEPGAVPVGLFVKYHEHKPNMDYINAWKARTIKWEYVLEGTNKKEWDAFLFTETDLTLLPDVVKTGMRSFDQIYLNVSFNNFGNLTVSTSEPLQADHFDILLRFAKVFDSTYTRFNDLQKAEAQAREAQIQLALERVRSRTMAMYKSDELSEVVFDFFKQMYPLGFAQWGFALMLVDEAQQGFNFWLSAPNGRVLPESYYLPKLDHRASELLWSAYSNQLPISYLELKDEEKLSWDLLLFEKSGFGKLPDNVKEEMLAIPYVMGSLVSMKYGLMEAIDVNPLPEDLVTLLQRFAKVFEQTYTRFLDLQKAEEQAREAQIEATLERVRSRSMGMQKSEELKEVIKVVYDQLVHLNIKLDHAGFVVDYQPKADWHFWIADKQEIPSKITHPYFESVWATQFNNAKAKGEELFVTYLNFEEKNKFYNELLSYVPGLPQASKDFYLNCPALAASTVLLDNVRPPARMTRSDGDDLVRRSSEFIIQLPI